MIVLTAEQALDEVQRGTVLVCFASDDDLAPYRRTLDRLSHRTDFKIVRVDPTKENALTLQLIRVPTFLLYRGGNEVGNAVGDAFNRLVAENFR